MKMFVYGFIVAAIFTYCWWMGSLQADGWTERMYDGAKKLICRGVVFAIVLLLCALLTKQTMWLLNSFGVLP